MHAPEPSLPIRRNVFLLAAAVAMLNGQTQLTAAAATITFVLVSGIQVLLGLGPALFLASGALAAWPAGRAMDRFGRIPVIATGFGVGIAGGLLIAAGAAFDSTAAVILGFICIGVANATAMLARVAAADMFLPEFRGRGIASVLFGAVFGAILGPLVFMPLFAGKALTVATLVVPWLAAAGFMAAGLLLVLQVRPDPRRIAEALAASRPDRAPSTTSETVSLSAVLRRPGIVPALAGILASFVVMVMIMTLAGYILVSHGHHAHAVFPAVSAHFIGMYGLALVVGVVVDRLGRTPTMVMGLLIVTAAVLLLAFVRGLWATSLCMFALGVGWNLAYVAATAQLADLTSVSERGRLMGFSDLLAGFLSATLVLLGGAVLNEVGLMGLCLSAAVLVLVPTAWILFNARARTHA